MFATPPWPRGGTVNHGGAIIAMRSGRRDGIRGMGSCLERGHGAPGPARAGARGGVGGSGWGADVGKRRGGRGGVGGMGSWLEWCDGPPGPEPAGAQVVMVVRP